MSGQIQTLKSQLNVKIDESLHDELKILSIRTRKNLNEIVEEALLAQLEEGFKSENTSEGGLV